MTKVLFIYKTSELLMKGIKPDKYILSIIVTGKCREDGRGVSPR